MQHYASKINSKYLQRGMTTLAISLSMLMMITMVSVMSANNSVVNIKTNSNEYRALQALLSAQAGIDYSLSNLSKSNTANISETAIKAKINGVDVISGYYSVAVDATDIENLLVTSTGRSADKSTSKTITQRLPFASALRSDARAFMAAPLIASGDAQVDQDIITTGSGAHDAPAKVWAGGVISGKNIPKTLPKSTAAGKDKQLAMSKIAGKLYEKDPGTDKPLKKLYSPQMRANNNLLIKHQSVFKKCISNCVNPDTLINANGHSKVHYLKGGVTLDNVTSGTPTNPIMIVIDLTDGGEFLLTNNTVINGILMVLGDWDNQDKVASINGVVVVDGTLRNGEKLRIDYNESVLNKVSTIGSYVRLPGGWKDN